MITDQQSGNEVDCCERQRDRRDQLKRREDLMAMSAGGGKRADERANVTPMIDVLLVLLIIFMMVIPMARKAIDVQLPDPTPQPTPANRRPTRSCSKCCLDGAVHDQQGAGDEGRTLCSGSRRSTTPRPEKIIFVKGDPKVKYQDVIFAMDMARGAA